MSTDNQIQFLDTTDGEGNALGAVMNRQTVETFIAGGTIALGDWVVFDSTQTGYARAVYVVQAPGVATLGNAGAFGVAKAAAASGAEVEVIIGGYCPVAKVAAATVAGSPLCGPIGTAGQAEIETAATSGNVCGIALEADTANLAAVMVKRSF